MPYLGRAPVGAAGNIIDGDLKVTGQLTAQDTLFKQILNGTDGSSSNAGDNLLIEDGGTDGSGTNAGDDMCLEKGTESISPPDSGSVLQTLTATDSTVRTTTSTSYAVNSNTLQVDITPSSASSKVLIMVTSGSYSDSGAAIGHFTIYRDTTNLGPANGIAIQDHADGVAVNAGPLSMVYLDSPSSMSQLTYGVQFKTNNGSYTIGMNGTASGVAQKANIIVQEIAG